MKTLFSLTLLLLTACLAGCMQNEDNSGNAPKGGGRVLTVNYSFDTPMTRVVANSLERKVEDVAILFYKADNNDPDAETYVDFQTAIVPSGSGSMGSFPLPLPETIREDEQYRLILIGNYNHYMPDGKTLEAYAGDNLILTYSQMKDQISATLQDDARISNPTPLPFYGRLSNGESEDITLTGPSATDTSLGISVRFSRAVARFDVVNLAAGKLKIKWVKVCNYRNEAHYYLENVARGTIVRGTAAHEPGFMDAGYVPAGEPIAGEGGALRQNLTSGGLYAFPNVVSYTVQNDRNTTFLMIAGQFKGEEDADYSDAVTYYRANISQNGGSQLLRRNYVYTLAINNVKDKGADTEEGAANEKEKLLDYRVDDEWEDSDGGGTVTDKDGNFLTLSRSAVVLPGDKDASMLIKVSVKAGTGWDIEWKEDSEDAFRYEKVDANSFTITTNEANPTPLPRNAKLTVKVTGITSNLTQEVSVIQLSNTEDPALLVVDGKIGQFAYTIPGQGATLSLPVVTGSAQSKWRATPDADLRLCLSATNINIEGSNNGIVSLEFTPNTSGEIRSGTMKVERLINNGTTVDTSVDPVIVTFSQEMSPYVVTVLPNYAEQGVKIIDAFDPTPGGPTATPVGANAVSAWLRFQVVIANPTDYPNFTILSSFNQTTDAFLSAENKGGTNRAAYYPAPSTTVNPSTINVTSNDGRTVFWLNVFRTGPGDKSINGTITVTAKGRASNYPNVVYSFPVTITSSCQISDSKIGNTLWADRNVGTTPRSQSLVGLHYTNYTLSAEIVNINFRGSFHTQAQVDGVCATFGEDNEYEGDLMSGWRAPTYSEMATLAPKICWSKGRGFVISEDTSDGMVGSWFPVGGRLLNGTFTNSADYWGAMKDASQRAFFRVQSGTDCVFSPSDTYNDVASFMVRCVRPII